MESPLAVYKLIILHMLDRNGNEMAMDHISSFLLEEGYANFVSLTSSYAQLEESGLVRSRTAQDRVFLHITQEGKDALTLFRGELSGEIRAQADAFLRSNRMLLQSENASQARIRFTDDGLYEACLSVTEGAGTLMRLSLRVPDKATAEEICRQWPQKSEDIYRAVIEKLF